MTFPRYLASNGQSQQQLFFLSGFTTRFYWMHLAACLRREHLIDTPYDPMTFPLLSDFLDRKVSQKYGIYVPKYGIANRVTFVVDTGGKIDTIESGGDAIKMLKTPDACSRLAHRKANGS